MWRTTSPRSRELGLDCDADQAAGDRDYHGRLRVPLRINSHWVRHLIISKFLPPWAAAVASHASKVGAGLGVVWTPDAATGAAGVRLARAAPVLVEPCRRADSRRPYNGQGSPPNAGIPSACRILQTCGLQRAISLLESDVAQARGLHCAGGCRRGPAAPATTVDFGGPRPHEPSTSGANTGAGRPGALLTPNEPSPAGGCLPATAASKIEPRCVDL